MSDKQANAGYLENLDILRAIAILLVFFFHVQIDLLPGFRFGPDDYGAFFLKDGQPLQRTIWNLVPSAFGASGVELFLLISGFLIHFAWLRSKARLSLSDFFSKRFWRIYPPYLISLIVLVPLTGQQGWKDILLHVFLVHNLSEASFFSINPSYWSLALEAQLYLVYPIALFLRARFGLKRTLFVLACLSLLASVHQYLTDPLDPVLDKSLLKFWVFWVLGAFLAETYHSGKKLFRYHHVWLLLIAILLVLSKFSVLHQPTKFYLYTLFHAVLLELFLHKRITGSGRWSKALIAGSVSLGLCSYSFYLYHQPVLREVIEYTGIRLGGLQLFMAIAGIFVLVLVISWLSYKYVELVSIRIGRMVRDRKTG